MRFAGIRRGEVKLAVLLFTYFFLITAPHTIIKALRTTNLLVRVGVGALPLAFLIAALLTALIVLFHSKILSRVSLQFLIIASLVFFAITGLGLQLVLETRFGRDSGWLPYVYWVWAAVLIVMLMTHFWMAVNELFNPREAKRLIGFISSGGILGGVIGGALAGSLTKANQAQLLLPIACGLLLACVFVVRAIRLDRRKQPDEAPPPAPSKVQPEASRAGFRASFDAVRRKPYLSLIAAITAIGIIVSTLIEFQFFSAVQFHYGRSLNFQRDMQVFLGYFFGAMPLVAFFVNIFLTGKLLKKMKVTLLLAPVTLLAGSVAMLLLPFSLYPATIFLKGSDESLDFSLKQTVREILYIPVAPDLKLKAKPFIDMFISRTAKVAAAVMLLVFALLQNKKIDYLTPVFDPGLAKSLSWVVIAFLIPWLWAGLKVGREYVAAITGNIKRKWERVDRAVTEQLDLDSTKDVFDALDSRNRSSELFAMHLFDLLERDKLTPEVKAMISEKAGEARAASMTDLFKVEGCAGFPQTEEEVCPEELIADVREILSMASYQELMNRHADQVLEASQKAEIEKMELAKAIGLMDPEAPLVERLGALLEDDSSDVASTALKSAARLRKEEHIPAIIRRLGDPRTREEAIDALHKYGETARHALEETLHDGRRPLPVRQAVVEVLARAGTQEAASALMDALERGAGDLDPEIIDALDRSRTENPGLEFPDRIAKRKTLLLVKKYCRAFLDLQGLGPGEEDDAARRELSRRLEAGFSDIFKMLGLFYPHEEILKAYQNIKTGTRNSVAYAVELLDNTLKKDVHDIILALVEDLTISERRQRFEKIVALMNKLVLNEPPTDGT